MNFKNIIYSRDKFFVCLNCKNTFTKYIPPFLNILELFVMCPKCKSFKVKKIKVINHN